MAKRQAKGRRDSERCFIVGRTVNFNLEDPHQKWLYEMTQEWTNFSGRIKRIIESEISGEPVSKTTDAPERTTTDTLQPEWRQEALNESEFDPISQLLGR